MYRILSEYILGKNILLIDEGSINIAGKQILFL